MALKGEGDPRWVVKEREDGTNVNGWHWTDKDVSAWAYERIKQLLSLPEVSLPGDGNHFGINVETPDTVEGDATLYNRKGTLKVLYDLKVSGKWSSSHEEADDRTRGEFKFELFDEDPDIVVTIDPKSTGEQQYKELFKTSIVPTLISKCREFITELHAGAGTALGSVQVAGKKPKKEEPKVTDYLRSGMNQKESPRKNTASTLTLNLNDQFTCSTMDLFMALTDRPRLEAITRSRVESDPTKGGKLNLMNGKVTGTYLDLRPGASVNMTWHLDSWGSETVAADVQMNIKQNEDGKCDLDVTLVGVPKQFSTETEGFWRVQIFQSIKVVMGYGRASSFF